MQISYSKPVSHGPHQGQGPSSQGPCHSPCENGVGGVVGVGVSGGGGGEAVGGSISHTVSTPELANTKQLPSSYAAAAANMLRNHMSRPPPPYPCSAFRPATSTPDLASHRHRCMGGSSPELVTRMVQLSVKTFQPDSSAVVHQSLQEVSEPLTTSTAAAKQRCTLGKRHSMEVVSSMRMEGLVMKGLNAPLHRRNTLREHVMPPQTPPLPQPQPPPPPPQPPPPLQQQQQPQQDAGLQPLQMAAQKATETAAVVAPPTQVTYQHQKTLSNATMLIHSSESEEEDEEEEERPELDVQIPGLNEDVSISAQLQAALAKLPNKPPPEYPGPPPRAPGSSGVQVRSHAHHPGHAHHHNHTPGPVSSQGALVDTSQEAGGGSGTMTRVVGGEQQAGVNGAVLGPSISEPDLTSVKERVRKEPVKERPVSEMFSLEDSIVEREIAQRVRTLVLFLNCVVSAKWQCADFSQWTLEELG